MDKIDYKKILGDNIKNYRALHNISRFKFSIETEVDKDTLAAIEHYVSNAKYSTIEKIATQMGVSMAEIFLKRSCLISTKSSKSNEINRL